MGGRLRYQLHVGGNTDLTGAVIASTADPAKNRLSTGSLSYGDIENQAHYDAFSVNVSGGYSNGGSSGPSSHGFDYGGDIPEVGRAHSSTRAGIAEGSIEVRDNPSQDLSGLDRHPNIDASGLKTIFDKEKVAERQELGQLAGYVGMRSAGSIADYMSDHASTEAEQKSWQDGGANKVLLHGLVGAATAALGGGDVAGALRGGRRRARRSAGRCRSSWSEKASIPKVPKARR